MFVLLPLLLTGCALSHQLVGWAAPILAGNKNEASQQQMLMPLASPQGPPRRIVQQLTALWPGRQETLLCVLELDNRRIVMVGLTNEGLSLFNLSYDGKTLQSNKNPLLPDSVAPAVIIADLQLVYWPVAALRKILPKHWRLETDSNHRRLYVNDDQRVEVHYLSTDVIWPKNVELINHHYNYRLHIQTISYETVSQ